MGAGLIVTYRRVVVVAMAGNAERFSRAGVQTPKWALRAGGKSLLEWSLLSVAPALPAARLILVVRAKDKPQVEEHLRGMALPHEPELCVSPEGPRTGQARDTARALNMLPSRELSLPLLVWNSDTIVRPAHDIPSAGDWLQLSRKRGNSWSFAEVAPRARGARVAQPADGCSSEVTRTAEKVRISPWASTGMYGFSTAEGFTALVSAHAQEPGELYVAPLYNDIVDAGGSVGASLVPAGSVTSMGTPRQFVTGCRLHSWVVPQELASFRVI